MSGYTVTVIGGSTYGLNEKDGFDLKRRWIESVESKTPFVVDLGFGDDAMKSSQILKISRNNKTQPDVSISSEKRIESNYCKGQFSIQKAINDYAKKISLSECSDNPNADPWAKLICDADWRSMVYYKLLETGEAWCDYRTGECNCSK